MKSAACFLTLFAVTTIGIPALGQTPGGPGDLSPHVDIGIDAATGQLVSGFTDIEAGTPIVLDMFQSSIAGGGGGFVNQLFSPDQDLAFRTASDSVASSLGFTSFGQFGEGVPQIAAEAVDFDPLFRSFVFPSSLVDDTGESLTLNAPGNGIDFHPFYFIASDDPDFIGRVEASWRFVPLTSTDIFSASDPVEFVFVVGGDFDDDSRLTEADEAILQDAIANGDTDAQFDLNRDDLVNDDDLAFFFTELLDQPFVLDALTGDFNGDGFVGQSDLDLVLLNFGDDVLPDDFVEASLSGGVFDGLIGQNELDDVLLNFGNSSASVAAVPEPATLGLLGLGWLAAGRRRR